MRPWQSNGINDPEVVIRKDGTLEHYFGAKHMVLRQLTGLKDKNGKEIHERDIVRITYGTDDGVNQVTTTIRWHNASASFVALNNMSALPHIEPLHHEVGVIGNTYENPELLAGRVGLH
jgi:uncharacterized phage protein (TIGR01671 family)